MIQFIYTIRHGRSDMESPGFTHGDVAGRTAGVEIAVPVGGVAAVGDDVGAVGEPEILADLPVVAGVAEFVVDGFFAGLTGYKKLMKDASIHLPLYQKTQIDRKCLRAEVFIGKDPRRGGIPVG